MKKVVLTLLIAAMVAGGAFALDMSAGLGGTFNAGGQNWNLTSDAKDWYDSDYFDRNDIGGGFFGYFDASYVMFGLGMTFIDESAKNKDSRDYQKEHDAKYTSTYFDISLYGKYPIDLGGVVLFPMLGVQFKIGVEKEEKWDGDTWKMSKDDSYAYDFDDEGNPIYEKRSPAEWMTTTWLKFGVGADFPISDTMYLRTIFLYGFGTLSKSTKENMDMYNDSDPKWVDSIVLHGMDLSIAIGFKF